MSVNSIGAYATQTATAAAAPAASGSGTTSGIAAPQLSENDFLTLLVAQMKEQDPTQPTDPTKFVSQLATFSEVSGMDNMQTSMSNLSGSMLASQVASGSSLVGRQILAATPIAALTSGGTVTGAVSAPANATSLQVQVTDANGNVVSTFSAPASGGSSTFTWNGLTSSGAPAPSGLYAFSVKANGGGSSTPIMPMFASTVTSVSLNPSTQALTLNTNTGSIPLSSVIQVQ